MQADVGEVGAEAGFHFPAQRFGQHGARRAQHLVHGGPLHRVLRGPLVAAVRTVLVPVLLEHTDDGGIAGGALQPHKRTGHPPFRPRGHALGGARRLLFALPWLLRVHGLPVRRAGRWLCPPAYLVQPVAGEGCTGTMRCP
ncbi:hypothetical protein GCM10010360_35240 [Streptomyces nogalater]